MGDPVAPSASCVRAHEQQIANNQFIILGDRLAAARTELDLVVAQGALRTANDAFDTFSVGERLAARIGVSGAIGYGAEAANVRAQLVLPREKTVRELAASVARSTASAVEIGRITEGIIARGPQRTGECSAIKPLPGMEDDSSHSRPLGRRDERAI